MNPTLYFNYAMRILQKSNPVGEMMAKALGAIDMIVNYNSNAKLHKFRQNMLAQQLNRLESFIDEGSALHQHSMGRKINRKY